MAHEDRGGPVPGASHDVICVHEVEGYRGARHSHVAALETREPDGSVRRWNIVDAVMAMRIGDRFFVRREGEHAATVEPSVCPRCQVMSLTVAEGAGLLPTCAG